ncbi:MAG: NAD(P)H-dependent oxidoreductase [Gorillibacterium sp.]|nr:NAD(P)H-dependent oxidoreductase [Gorillibacterium sp.]
MTQNSRILVLVVHPHLDQSRINKRLAAELERYDDITVHRLYDAYPDGQIDIAAEQQLILEHDRIIFQFPFFWYSAPALLKSWIDTVFERGWAYAGGENLVGKELGLAISTGATQDAYQAGGQNNFSISELLKPFQQTALRVGMLYRSPFVLNGVREISDAQLEQGALDYPNHIRA